MLTSFSRRDCVSSAPGVCDARAFEFHRVDARQRACGAPWRCRRAVCEGAVPKIRGPRQQSQRRNLATGGRRGEAHASRAEPGATRMTRARQRAKACSLRSGADAVLGPFETREANRRTETARPQRVERFVRPAWRRPGSRRAEPNPRIFLSESLLRPAASSRAPGVRPSGGRIFLDRSSAQPSAPWRWLMHPLTP